MDLAPSFVSESTSIRGRITGDGDLEIRGRFEGEIEITGELIIADSAIIRGALRAGRVVVRGAVLGDVVAGSIAIEETARLVGNLNSERITIAMGAQIRGELDMGIVGAKREAKPRAAVIPAVVRPAARPLSALTPRPSPFSRSGEHVAVATAAPDSRLPALTRKEPPAPVMPAIKKGAKAPPPKKKGALP